MEGDKNELVALKYQEVFTQAYNLSTNLLFILEVAAAPCQLIKTCKTAMLAKRVPSTPTSTSLV
jgi:hypothetical protein